ncbi:MAG: molybdenum cofactor guanylyltransferase [Bacteroidales bacterium]|jgi:molybdopterin-guanine dinucleotide biosynthesis protein A|nr:molybdenum cofactor guanylyltransferase [Bacteroidales bacterium]
MAPVTTGVILAGGKNIRFGGITKANVVIEGETIISRILRVFRGLFDEIIIVTNNPEEFRSIRNVRLVEDIIRGAGPLGGIHAALKSSKSEAIFVIAGDMPFPDRRIIEDQMGRFSAANHDILTVKIGNLVEPLHSVFSKKIFDDLETFLEQQGRRTVRDFLEESDTAYFDIPDTEEARKAFRNINFPDEV